MAGFLAGPAWMWAARRAVGRAEMLDGAAWREPLEPFFGRALVDAATVRVVERVRPPGTRVARLLGVRLFSPAGLCLGDTIVVTREAAASGRALGVVFHELVHGAQMRRAGKARFCADYLAGWIEGGYLSIPAEAEAYALQERFERGEVFSVPAALGERQA